MHVTPDLISIELGGLQARHGANIPVNTCVVPDVDTTDESGDHFGTEVDRASLPARHVVQHFGLDEVHGAVGQIARRVGHLLVEPCDDPLVVQFEDAAGFRRIGSEGHHRDDRTRRPLFVRAHKLAKITEAQVIRMGQQNWFAVEEMSVGQKRSACSKKVLFVNRRDHGSKWALVYVPTHGWPQVMRVDEDWPDSSSRQVVQPDTEQRTTSNRDQTFGNRVCQWAQSRTKSRGQKYGLHL